MIMHCLLVVNMKLLCDSIKLICIVLYLDSTFTDTIPQQNKHGLMKVLLGYVGIKSQDTAMPFSSTVGDHDTTYNPPPSSVGMTSSMNYQTPNRDIQNRKVL